MTNKKNLEEILIIEDSPTQAERLRYVLEQHGYRVSMAGNGREAMVSLANHKPDLVISDILMPEADGYAVCRFLRQHRDLQNVPVILLTALSDPVDVMRALECGADNFLIKPFEANQLLQRVQLFLLNRDLHKPEGVQEGLAIVFQGQRYFINSDRLQILNLLLSTYEAAVEKNSQLLQAQTELQSQAEELESQSEELRAQNEELVEMAEELRVSEGRAQRQAQILTAINRVFHEAIICETEEELGRTCLTAAEELTGSRFGFIGEINEAGLLDVIAISDSGWAACRVPGFTKRILPKAVPIRGVFGKAIKDERSVIANEPAAHPDSVGTPQGHPELTAFLGVPLKQGGKTIGMLGLGNKPGGYDRADQEAAEALAPGIVESFLRKRAEKALKQAHDELEQRVKDRTAELRLTVAQLQEEVTHRLQTEESLKESEGRLRHLTTQLLTAQEAERGRLALELHDDLGQSLMALKMQLRAIQRKVPESSETRESLEYPLDFINEVIEKIRHLSRNLRPTILEDLGLTGALRHLFEDFSNQGILVTMNLDDIQGLFSQEAQLIIYRIFQESFSNITRYAQASQVSVSIKRQAGSVAFQVEDNGKGFDHQKVINENITDRGLGLTSMDERARILGGSFNIWSQEGRGTKITLIVPIRVK